MNPLEVTLAISRLRVRLAAGFSIDRQAFESELQTILPHANFIQLQQIRLLAKRVKASSHERKRG